MFAVFALFANVCCVRTDRRAEKKYDPAINIFGQSCICMVLLVTFSFSQSVVSVEVAKWTPTEGLLLPLHFY